MQELKELYVEQLKDAWSAENQIVKALPKMIDEADDESLRSAFEEHLTITEGQIGRLETIFDSLGETPGRKQCKGMEGLLEEGEEALKDGAPDVKDAAMIGAAQKVEHYEIALYGTLRTYARMIGRGEDESLLQASLEEEEEADRVLSEIAESRVNQRAQR